MHKVITGSSNEFSTAIALEDYQSLR